MISDPRLPVRTVGPLRLGPVTKKRYLELIQCFAKGLTQKEVAQATGKSYETVKHDAERMRKYFGAATTIEAILIARREWNLDL